MEGGDYLPDLETYLKQRQEKLIDFSSMKALQIISALAYVEEPMNIQELSSITGLSNSTIHRVLQELLQCGYVAKDDVHKRYRMGHEIMNLGMRIKTSNYLLEAAIDEMKRLNDLTGETIHLIARVDEFGVYTGKVDSRNNIALRSRIGGRLPLTCTSGGKAILAFESREWVENYLKNVPLKRYTDFSIVTKPALYNELAEIRKQGYALDNREHNPDVQCVAVPVFSADKEHVLCAISIAAPQYRFSMEMALSYVNELKQSGEAVSHRLSY